MVGIEVRNRPKKWIFVRISGCVFLASLIVLIWKGPVWTIVTSLTGLIVSLTGLYIHVRRRDEVPFGWSGGLLATGHIILLGVSLVFQSLFLKPLPDVTLSIPSLSYSFVDPGGKFKLKGPEGWNYQVTSAAGETGVTIVPASQDHYMGVSEIQVWVRELSSAPPSPSEFLDRMVASVNYSGRKGSGDAMFQLRTETVDLINGGKGVVTVLDIKKFWIPIRQITLFGMKNGRYFCSISSTGLREHATLSKVLCLGLFETLKITKGENIK